MIKRRPGTIITYETRGEANESVDRRKRYAQIRECLEESGEDGLTAKECAVMMMEKGFIPTSERNFTAPRLTEMAEKGIVEPVGKKKCQYTGKTVSVYVMRETA